MIFIGFGTCFTTFSLRYFPFTSSLFPFSPTIIITFFLIKSLSRKTQRKAKLRNRPAAAAANEKIEQAAEASEIDVLRRQMTLLLSRRVTYPPPISIDVDSFPVPTYPFPLTPSHPLSISFRAISVSFLYPVSMHLFRLRRPGRGELLYRECLSHLLLPLRLPAFLPSFLL